MTRRLGSVEKMAESPSAQVRDVITKARAALEIENSLWVTEKMPGFGMLHQVDALVESLLDTTDSAPRSSLPIQPRLLETREDYE